MDIENIEIIVETLPVSRETRGKRKCEAEQTKTPPRNKIALSFMEPENMIVSIEKSRTRRRQKYK